MDTLQILEDRKQRHGISYRRLCRETRLSFSNLMRWRRRIRRGEPVKHKPGPKKAVRLHRDQLLKDIEILSHGQERTRGTGRLYECYRLAVSRRELGSLVRMSRESYLARRAEYDYDVQWHAPGLVWSVDDSQHAEAMSLEVVQDLSSRYKHPPQEGKSFPGVVVAAYLEDLFKRHVPPLFIKRDNASNLNSLPVAEVLDKYGVLPLNSPVYDPQYNGGIEHAQDEIKKWIAAHAIGAGVPLVLIAGMAATDLNHKPRAVLGGKVACEVFFKESTAKNYDMRRRKELKQWIQHEAADILAKTRNNGRAVSAAAAWRKAVRTWLEYHGLIVVTPRAKVLPYFPTKCSH